MTRFAGDYFGISIADEDDGGSSKLLSYFPGLRNTFGKKLNVTKTSLFSLEIRLQ